MVPMVPSSGPSRLLLAWAMFVLALLTSGQAQLTSLEKALIQAVEQSSPANDVYAKLSDASKAAWAAAPHVHQRSAQQTLEAMTHMEVAVQVEVRLVCFSGTGADDLVLPEANLLALLRALAAADNSTTTALHPSPRRLVARPAVSYIVRRATPALCDSVSSALRAGLQHAAAAAHGHNLHGQAKLLVPHTSVEEVVAADKRSPSSHLTLYVLNPAVKQAYAYSYGGAGGSAPGGPAGHCSGSLWLGSGRYAWVDLSAGPVRYGPSEGGSRGAVFEGSLPRLSAYKRAALPGALLPDLAALAVSATRHLAWPPLHHGALHTAPKLLLHVVHMHDTLARPTSGRAFDAQALAAQLSGAVSGAMEVRVEEAWVSWAECDACAGAWASALRTRTELNGRAEDVSVTYLDSHVAHAALLAAKHRILEASEPHDGADASKGATTKTHHGDEANVRVLPVFVFHLGGGAKVGQQRQAVLINRWLQAVGYSDMVIAVRHVGLQPVAVPWACEGQQLSIRADDLACPLLAATAASAFSLADPALYWSEATGGNSNYLWSIGQGPGPSPLTALPVLSGALAEAALRNLALLHLNRTVTKVATLLAGLAQLAGPEGSAVSALPLDLAPTYRGRMAVLDFKLARLLAALAEPNNKLALHYAQSSAHEAEALVRLAARVDATLESRLACRGSAGVPWSLWLTPAVAVTMFVAALIHRCTQAPKRKVY